MTTDAKAQDLPAQADLMAEAKVVAARLSTLTGQAWEAVYEDENPEPLIVGPHPAWLRYPLDRGLGEQVTGAVLLMLARAVLAPSSAIQAAERRGIERAAREAEGRHDCAAIMRTVVKARDNREPSVPRLVRAVGQNIAARIRALSPLSGGTDGEAREALRALVKDYRETVRCAVEIIDNLGWKVDPVEKQLAGSNAYRTASALLARLTPAAETPDA